MFNVLDQIHFPKRATNLHFFEDIPPKRNRWQPPRMKLPTVQEGQENHLHGREDKPKDHDTLAIEEERVLVKCHGRRAMVRIKSW